MLNYNIIVANNNYLFREGLGLAIERCFPYCNLFTAFNGFEVINLLNRIKVDLVFLDSRMPQVNGIETTSILKKSYPDIKVIGISLSDDLYEIMKMIDAGVNGYLMSNSNDEIISKAIEKTINGENYFADDIKFLICNGKIKNGNGNPGSSNNGNSNHGQSNLELTEKEKRILVLICRQYSNKEISKILTVCEKTVEMHRSNILVKTNAKNIIGCVLHAIEKGIYKT